MTIAAIPSPGGTPGLSVSRLDGWLVLDQRSLRPDDLGSLLDRNADLPGPERFCLDGDGNVHLRIDLPISSWDDEVSELGDGEDRIEAATAAIMSAGNARTGEVRSEDGIARGPIPAEVAAICELARRTCTQLSPYRWMVTIDTGAYFCQAELTVGGAYLHLSVPLLSTSSATPDAHRAISTALLLAGGACRTVRPVRTASSDGATAYWIGARVPLQRFQAEFQGALSALCLAAHALVREVQVLLDPDLAALYLQLCKAGNPPDTAQSIHPTKRR